MKTSFDRS